ncbi:MAG: T9SS type A sorting domain-containing protein [Bacteroidetes bacterium]|nr:T9SS type A sorting domain-containing protein [Bacteroidota bacterium]
MKKLFLLLFIGIVIKQQAQVISNTLNKSVPCCSPPNSTIYRDSVDINGDNINEVKIISKRGLDNIYYTAIGSNNLLLSGCNNIGQPFTSFSSIAAMPSTPIGYTWVGWIPNSGFKYLGFRKLNAPGDTTFGWIKLDFVGNLSGPLDTVKILQYAYNSAPNVHLDAGQLFLNSVTELNLETQILIYPTITKGILNIENKLSQSCNYRINNIIGKLVQSGICERESISNLDISQLPCGLYFTTVNNGSISKTIKIIKD